MRIAIVLISIFFLALDWLALDDITTGNQPTFHAEYAMLLLSAAWFAAAAVLWRRPRPV
ncbi:MAG TPA: hypothetical protein VFR31_18060 [Thermoanaerobaculia bacterium]|nr:hypothetical protein [Thermoanaerobaculia bacterium]